MARVKDIVRAHKTDVAFTGWKSGGMPKLLFPLGRSGRNSLNLRAFDWCGISFRALSSEFRMLIAVNFEKEEYYAHLGRVCGGDTQMLCSYEFHATHPGWHVHAGCGDTALIPVGRYKGPWKRRIPRDPNTCRDTALGVLNLEEALARACALYGIPVPPSDPANAQMPLLS